MGHYREIILGKSDENREVFDVLVIAKKKH